VARPEAEVDGSTPEGRFALKLRALREQAKLEYRAMEKHAHFVASTLSKAASGNGVPTLEVTLAYVRACGGKEKDEQEWTDRWHKLNAEVRQRRLMAAGAVTPQPSHHPAKPGTSPERVPQHDGLGSAGGPVQVTGKPKSVPDQRTSVETTEEQADPEAVTDRIVRVGLSTTTGREALEETTQAQRSAGRHRAEPPGKRSSKWGHITVVAVVAVLALMCGWVVSWKVTLKSTSKDQTALAPQAALLSSAGAVQPFEIEEIEQADFYLVEGEGKRSVSVRNPNPTPLIVINLTAQADVFSDASGPAGKLCSSDLVNISTVQKAPYRIDPHDSREVTFNFTVSRDNVAPCEGVKIRINYSGEAVLGTVVEGKEIAG
jgi:hypothetical protein